MQLNQDKSSTGAIVNLVPELFDKIQGLFTKDKGDKKINQAANNNVADAEPDLSSDSDDITLDISDDDNGPSNYAGEFNF